MRLPKHYSTSIDDLLINRDSQTIFLSTWDRNISENDVPMEIINESVSITLEDISKYQYMDEMHELKEYISNSISTKESQISPSMIAIATNGTASAYLVLKTLAQKKHLRPLLLTPIYFTYISSLKELCDSIEFSQVFYQEDIIINLSEIEHIITEESINTMIINDPIFGCGVAVKEEIYELLAALCKKHEITLIIDYVYGGMEWCEERWYLPHHLQRLLTKGLDIIVIDSLSKRLFINGIKSAVIYGPPSFICEIEKASVYTLGCMTYSLVSLIKELYDPHNIGTIFNAVNKNIINAKNNYQLICSLLLDKNCFIEKCDSGHFALIKIPYDILKMSANSCIAKSILEKCNVITIPHDRYLYFNDKYYCFRINLLSDRTSILTGIRSIIKQLC